MLDVVRPLPYKGVIVELKNNIIKHSIDGIEIPLNTYKSIHCCGATAEYQCGRLTKEKYYTRLESDFELSRNEIEVLFRSIEKSLHVDETVLKSLEKIKDRFRGQLKIYAVANLSQEDYVTVCSLPINWALFDEVFISGNVGMRKPELRFYKHILNSTRMLPEELIYIDDDTDNILAVISMGIEGILTPIAPIGRTIINLVDVDAVSRGMQFLRDNAKNYPSLTHSGVAIRENFAQLMILDLVDDM
jgi:HAD superfamily hydrolase (TIGR01509 family)